MNITEVKHNGRDNNYAYHTLAQVQFDTLFDLRVGMNEQRDNLSHAFRSAIMLPAARSTPARNELVQAGI